MKTISARSANPPWARLRHLPWPGMVALGACSLATQPSFANTTYTYQGTGTATDPASGNFSTGFSPTGLGSGSTTTTLSFAGKAGDAAYTANNDISGLTLNELLFNSLAAGPEYITGNGITFGGTTPTITQSGSAAFVIQAALTSTAGIAFNGSGAGGVVLDANSSFSGATNNYVDTQLTIGDALDAPTISFSSSGPGSSTGIYLDSSGAALNVANGSVTSTSVQGLVLSGFGSGDSYTQTGGTFSTNGRIELANNSGKSVVNVSAGSLTSTFAAAGIETVRGTSVINLSGTGTITAPILDMTTTQISGGAANSTFNLNGGTLIVGQIIPGTNGTGTGGSNGTFNFNGGSLQSSASSATYMQGLTKAFVGAGGAVFNTNGFTDTIGQALLTGGGTDGGVTKNGTGTLVLAGLNTYTGATSITAGTLQTGSSSALGSTSGVSVTSGAVLDLDGNTQSASPALTLNGTGISSGGALVNSSATAATYAGPITLGAGSGSGTSSKPYISSIVASSGALITTGAITESNAGNTTLTLGGTGTAGNDLQSTLTDSSGYGLVVSKAGAGTWTLGGSGTSSDSRGGILVSAGTLNYGSATETPSWITTNAPASNGGLSAGLYITGGNFNMVNGTLSLSEGPSSGLYGLYDTGTNSIITISGGMLTVNPATNNGQGIILNSNQTYSQTGGTVSTNGLIEFANGSTGAVSTVNISAGSLTTTSKNANDATDLAVRGTTTFTLSGTGTFTTPVLNMSTSQLSSGSATSTFNLNGGTLITGSIIKGTGGSTGTQTFNFNGGTLEATASNTAFMTGLTSAVVQNGGANINTNGFTDTIGQKLTGAGALNNNGAGALILNGSGNSYSGGTNANAGTLDLNSAGADGTGTLTINGGAVVNVNVTGGDTSSDPIINGGVYNTGATGALSGPTTIENGGTLANTLTSSGGTANDVQSGGVITIGNGTNILNFGASNQGAKFMFASPGTFSGMLDVLNWNGNYSPTGGGLDQFFIGTSQDLTSAQLADIMFVSPTGNGVNNPGTVAAYQLINGEIVAAPEPSEVAMIGLFACGLGGLLLRAKKRVAA